MFEFNTIYGVPGWGLVGPERVDRAPDPDAKAKPGDATARDQSWPMMTGGLVNGYDDAEPSSLELYWRMRRYSAIALAIQAITGPILAGTQTFEIRRRDGTEVADDEKPKGTGPIKQHGPEDKLKAALERYFAPWWPVIHRGLECIPFGRWEFETPWERCDGLTLPKFKPFGLAELIGGRVRPLEFNQEFAGLAYSGGPGGETRLAPQQCLHFVANSHLDPISGVSWCEFAKQDWHRAVESGKNGDRLERKPTGRNMLLHIAAGKTFVDERGQPVVSREVAQAAFNALSSGGAAMLPRTVFRYEDIKGNPALADISPIKVDQFDWTSTGPDVMAQIARLDATDKRIIRAFGLPERALTEATSGGSRADSETHGAGVGNVAELVHAEELRQFNEQTLNYTLVTNKGPDWRGRIFAKPAQSGNDDKGWKQGLIEKLITNAGDPANHMADRERLFAETETPFDHDWQKKADAAKAEAAKNVPPAPNGKIAVAVNGFKSDAKPGTPNGTPPANGRVAALAGKPSDEN